MKNGHDFCALETGEEFSTEFCNSPDTNFADLQIMRNKQIQTVSDQQTLPSNGNGDVLSAASFHAGERMKGLRARAFISWPFRRRDYGRSDSGRDKVTFCLSITTSFCTHVFTWATRLRARSIPHVTGMPFDGRFRKE